MTSELAHEPTVLVIDDEETMLQACRQTLEQQGYRAAVARDGESGLQIVQQMKPSVVLIDLKMPRMNGFEVLDKIQKSNPDARCVVMTGYGTIESGVQAMKMGASDFLCKPFDDTRLLKVVESSLARKPVFVDSPGETKLVLPVRPRPDAVIRAEQFIPTEAKAAPQPASLPKHFLAPREVAQEVISIAKTKCGMKLLPMALLGILAGVYIGFGAQLCTMVTHDMAPHFGQGFAKFMGASVFTVGLMLVVLAGAELFTGNCLILTAVLSGDCQTGKMLRNWTVVFLANFIGALLLAGILWGSGLWKTGNWGVGAAALKVAHAKVSLSFSEAFLRGVACNWLVCLAVWLAIVGRDAVSKILGIYFPIMAFVASGFEHSIANMYFIPAGLLLKADAAAVSAAGLGGVIGDLTWPRFLTANLLPVTLGNIVGGAVFVGAWYYYVYLRKESPAPAASPTCRSPAG